MNTILKKFPDPEKAGLLEIQEFAGSFKNDNTRKNICVIIRRLFNDVLNRNIQWYELPYPKKKKKVQPIYSEEEIITVLNSIQNQKQKALLTLIIDCGLRVSEPCKILLTDCDSKNGSITIRSAKGKNDRIVYPSMEVWNLIREYWKAWKGQRPKKYLFEGQQAGQPYTVESVRGILKTHCQKTGVKYKAVHAIRRFNGSWRVQNGIPETVVADNLGNSVKTLHKHYLIHSPEYLRNLKSPLHPNPS